VEQEGVRRARARAAEADLVLWLADAESGDPAPAIEAKTVEADVLEANAVEAKTPLWMVRNKIDLGAAGPDANTDQRSGDFRFAISASRGDGLPGLIAALVAFAQNYFGAAEEALIGRERQRVLLRQAGDSLQRGLSVAGRGEELIAEELRAAAYSLGRLLGRVDVEDILEVIFREFCVGK
jgi:tRNA modification GTPase